MTSTNDDLPWSDPAVDELARRLDADLTALLAAVSGLSQTQSDWRPAPDRWSIGEVLDHLALSNRLFARVIAALVARCRSEGLSATPGGRRVWPRLRVVADAAASGPVANPARTTPAASRPIAELIAALTAAHAAIATQIKDLAGLVLAAARVRHPLGFDLNLFQWVDAAGAHERRHLGQIATIAACPDFPTPGQA